MALLSANCPRCKTHSATFDVAAQNSLGIVSAGWVEAFEVFSVCRNCKKSTVFIQINREYSLSEEIKDPSGLVLMKEYINNFTDNHGYVTLKDIGVVGAPDFTPSNIAEVFLEGSTCVSMKCWNAAGAMFRTTIDLATKGLLPPEGEPAVKVRRSLGLRLEWLFEHHLLPKELQELAEAVQQDGNDGVHDANLTEDDALDLHDFCQQLLTRIYTVPGRINDAKARRLNRRAREQ